MWAILYLIKQSLPASLCLNCFIRHVDKLIGSHIMNNVSSDSHFSGWCVICSWWLGVVKNECVCSQPSWVIFLCSFWDLNILSKNLAKKVAQKSILNNGWQVKASVLGPSQIFDYMRKYILVGPGKKGMNGISMEIFV